MFWDGDAWCYEDVLDHSICPRCGQPPTLEGYDACLGHIDGAVSACCGHGLEEQLVMMDTRFPIERVKWLIAIAITNIAEVERMFNG